MEKLNPKRIENILALTPLQEGLLFHYLQEPQSGLYFEQLCLSISGPVHLKLFAQAWNIVVETNEMLRSLFRWEKLEKPSLIILKEHPCRVIFYDLAENTTLEEIKYNDRRRPFDLQQVPFRVTLVKRAENEYEMIISNHHILYDGWSNGIILREFFQVYHRLCRGEQVVKIPAKPPFKEFVRWMQSRDKISRENYWREYLAGFEPPAESFLKKDCDVAAGANDYALIFAGSLIDQLDAFVKNNRVTLAAIFYTAWGLLLQKYSGSEDVVFGTTVSGRSAAIEGIEDMVGLFINT
ncbi:MAG TPA: condensation domain-containing protein, partial [Candidatus Deferrimicrobium sp.]|nr:condensation domain-containing protein [Candidatus Deferrimicrobium sp.]